MFPEKLADRCPLFCFQAKTAHPKGQNDKQNALTPWRRQLWGAQSSAVRRPTLLALPEAVNFLRFQCDWHLSPQLPMSCSLTYRPSCMVALQTTGHLYFMPMSQAQALWLHLWCVTACLVRVGSLTGLLEHLNCIGHQNIPDLICPQRPQPFTHPAKQKPPQGPRLPGPPWTASHTWPEQAACVQAPGSSARGTGHRGQEGKRHPHKTLRPLSLWAQMSQHQTHAPAFTWGPLSTCGLRCFLAPKRCRWSPDIDSLHATLIFQLLA